MLLLGIDQLEDKVIARDGIRPELQRFEYNSVGWIDFGTDPAQHVDFYAEGFGEFFTELVQLGPCEGDLFQFAFDYVEVDRVALGNRTKERLAVLDQHFDD